MKQIQESLECFRNLSAEEIQILSDKKAQITYLKNENIIKQGAFATHVIFVITGLVRIYLQAGNSKQVNIRLAKKGEFLAFSAVFGSATYSYSAIAMKDSLVCMVDKDALRELLMDNPSFGMQITARNYKREQRYLNIISNLAYKQMRGKLASALLYLSSDEFIGEDIFNHFTRQDIADFASVTIESAIKFLKEFEKEGILNLEGKDIVIKDKMGLELISKTG